MSVGTKSLLFGVHQIIIHPITVLLAWIYIFKCFPSFKELVCIIIHDWGYFGKTNMNDEDGEKHVELGARIASYLFGSEYADLCLFHSRHYARKFNKQPSKLCWADKFSLCFEFWWTYLPRAWLSGELSDYRMMAVRAGNISYSSSNREWFKWVQGICKKVSMERRGDAAPYQ
jgi:hypothetical protein